MSEDTVSARLPEAARSLFEIYARAGRRLYLVGGYVRDLLRGAGGDADLDMATDATPEESVRILEGAGIRAVPLGMEYGTVGAVMEPDAGGMVEITTFRCEEVYPPGDRHPAVRFGDSIEGDLVRRDFTVNAMALDAFGRLIDPTDGMGDLKAGLLRTPGDPDEVMREDPLRMLRALRFRAQLDFGLHGDVARAVKRGAPRIVGVAAERCKRELDRLMEVEDPALVAESFALMADLGLLPQMVPQMKPLLDSRGIDQGRHHHLDVWEHTLQVLANARPPDICLRWAALLHDAGKPASRTLEGRRVRYLGHQGTGREIALAVAERLRFSRRERRCVAWLVANHMRPLEYTDEWTDSAVRRLARDAGENLDRLLELAEADICAHAPREAEEGAGRLEALRRRLKDLSLPRGERVLPREVGRRLRSILPEERSSEIGRLLERLETAVARGDLDRMPPVDECIGYLRGRGELEGLENGQHDQPGGG